MFLLQSNPNQLDVFPQWREWAAGRWFCSVGLTVSVLTGTLWTISTPAPWAPGSLSNGLHLKFFTSTSSATSQTSGHLVRTGGQDLCVCVCVLWVCADACGLCEQACWCGRFSRRERRVWEPLQSGGGGGGDAGRTSLQASPGVCAHLQHHVPLLAWGETHTHFTIHTPHIYTDYVVSESHSVCRFELTDSSDLQINFIYIALLTIKASLQY